jgi:hypothetical protein
MLMVEVVDAIEIVLVRGAGGTSKSSLALLNELETSETLELGLERPVVDNRCAFLVVVGRVPFLDSGFTLAVPLAWLGDVGETAVLEVEVGTPLRRIVDVDFTEAARDFGRPAAGLSVADVVLVIIILRAGTFRAGGAVEVVGERALLWFSDVEAVESIVADLPNVAPVSFGVPGVDAVGDSTSGEMRLRAEEKEEVDAVKDSLSVSAFESRVLSRLLP